MGSFADNQRAKSAPDSGSAPSGSGTRGFFANAVGDLRDVASGLGTLGGSILGDIYGGVKEAATLGRTEADFATDDLAKGLLYNWEGQTPEGLVQDIKEHGINPVNWLADERVGRALKDDVSENYGMLLPGGRPAGEFATTVYEDPLIVLSDALAVASGGGLAAVKGAQTASRVGKVSKGLDALASGSDDVGRLVKTIDALLPKERPLVSATGSVSYATDAYSPLRRGFDSLVMKPIKSESFDAVQKRLIEAEKIAKDPSIETALRSKAIAEASQLRHTLNTAKSLGVGRIERAPVSNRKMARLTDRLYGHSLTSYSRHKNENLRELEQILAPKGVTHPSARLTDDDLERLPYLVQSIGDDRLPATERMSYTQIVEQIDSIDHPIADQMRAHVDHLGELEMDPATSLEELTAGKAYVEDLSEALNAELNNVTRSPAQRAVDALRVWNDKMTSDAVKRGLLNYETIMARAYLPLRKLTAKTTGQKWRDVDWRQLHEANLAAGIKPPMYFAHIDSRRVRFSDVFRKNGGAWGTSTPAALRRSKGYLFDHDLWEKNPLEVYSQRAIQMTKYLEGRDMMDKLQKQFGRPISSLDDLTAGERVFHPEAAHLHFKLKMDLEEGIADNLAEGMTAEDALAEAIKTSLPDINAMVQTGTQKSGQLYAIPAVVAKRLEDFGKRSGGWKARLFWDSPSDTWRSMVLAGSPRWIWNNLLGNTTFLTLQGGRLTDVAKIMVSPKFRKKMDELGIPQDVRSGFFADPEVHGKPLGELADHVPGQLLLAARETKPYKAAATITRKMRRANEIVEDAFRTASYLKAADRQAMRAGIKKNARLFHRSEDRLRRIAEVGMDEKLAMKAVDEVNEWLNDYSLLSPLERQWARRVFVPFYTFYKHVALMIAKMPFKHPAKFAMMERLTEVTQDFHGDFGEEFPFLEGAVPIGPGHEEDEVQFLGTRGPNVFNSVFQNPLTSLHPAIQTVIEQSTGRDLFTGKQFSAPGVQFDPSTGEQYTIDPQTGERVPTTVRPFFDGLGGPFEVLAQQVPQYDLIRDLMPGAGARYSTGETRVDEQGNPLYPVDPLQEVLRFLGAPTYDVNVNEFEKLTPEQLERLRGHTGGR